MLTFIFLGMVAIFAVAAILISIEAKRRSKGKDLTATVPAGPKVSRATPDND